MALTKTAMMWMVTVAMDTTRRVTTDGDLTGQDMTEVEIEISRESMTRVDLMTSV